MIEAYSRYFGNDIGDYEIKNMFERVDMSGSGAIEYTEFMIACIPDKVIVTDENLAILFRLYDQDGQGSISQKEVMSILNTSCKPISYELAGEILKEIDDNGDKYITFTEFKNLMKNLNIW